MAQCWWFSMPISTTLMELFATHLAFSSSSSLEFIAISLLWKNFMSGLTKVFKLKKNQTEKFADASSLLMNDPFGSFMFTLRNP